LKSIRGNKLTNGSKKISDDEFTDILVFELDQNQKSFRAENADLVLLKAHFKTVCFCSNVRFITITKGCLQGEQQTDGSWFIQGKLTVTNFSEEEIKIDSQFLL
jgi:hypothetical protein